MSKCPYCEIKENAILKTVYEAIQPEEGKCECGAFIDAGQRRVEVNGYYDIYKGCIKLIDGVVREFNTILSELDIDLKSEFGFDEDYKMQINTSEIIERLFIPYYGGTTKRNFAHALGIAETEHTWVLKAVEDD